MKEVCKILGIDYGKINKKWKKLYLISLLVFSIVYITISLKLSVIIFLLIYLYIQMDKQSYRVKAQKIKNIKYHEFINFISYITVFLENKFNVYQSLNICLPYINKYLQSDIELFIHEIDNDKSIVPYMNMGQKIDSPQINQIMMLLYQIDKSGSDPKYLNKFPYLLEKAYEINIKEKIMKKRNEMGIFSLIPLLSLLIIIFYMVFSIIGMVGGNIV